MVTLDIKTKYFLNYGEPDKGEPLTKKARYNTRASSQ
jgi:hypothetical protein